MYGWKPGFSGYHDGFPQAISSPQKWWLLHHPNLNANNLSHIKHVQTCSREASMISWKGGQAIQVLLATLGAGCLVGFRQGLEDGPELAVLVVSIAIYGWYPHGKSTSKVLICWMPYPGPCSMLLLWISEIFPKVPKDIRFLQLCPENIGNTLSPWCPTHFHISGMSLGMVIGFGYTTSLVASILVPIYP